MIVCVPPRPASINLPIVQDWELRVQGCAAYTEKDMLRAIEIAVSGGIPVTERVSSSHGLDDVAAACAAARSDTSGKVLVGVEG